MVWAKPILVMRSIRGATGTARGNGQVKTTIIQRRAAAAAPRSILKNQGKMAVLLVLPLMAPLSVMGFLYCCCGLHYKMGVAHTMGQRHVTATLFQSRSIDVKAILLEKIALKKVGACNPSK